MKRRIISVFLLALTVCSLALGVTAAAVQPRYNNIISTNTNFTISSAGKTTISAVYHGYQNGTTGATITSYIEKKTLGLFWSRVDIGEPNDKWLDTLYRLYGCLWP